MSSEILPPSVAEVHAIFRDEGPPMELDEIIQLQQDLVKWLAEPGNGIRTWMGRKAFYAQVTWENGAPLYTGISKESMYCALRNAMKACVPIALTPEL